MSLPRIASKQEVVQKRGCGEWLVC